MNAPADIRTIPLLRPISVNGMYRNKRGKGRVVTERYRTWRNAAGWEAKTGESLAPINGPVHITLYVSEDGVRNMDLDNTAKGYLDLFVALGVIEDDNRKIVRSLNLSWVSGPGRAIIQKTNRRSS